MASSRSSMPWLLLFIIVFLGSHLLAVSATSVASSSPEVARPVPVGIERAGVGVDGPEPAVNNNPQGYPRRSSPWEASSGRRASESAARWTLGAYVYDYDEEGDMPGEMAAAGLPAREVTVPCMTIKPGELFILHPHGCAWVLKQAVARGMKVVLMIEASLWDNDLAQHTTREWLQSFVTVMYDTPIPELGGRSYGSHPAVLGFMFDLEPFGPGKGIPGTQVEAYYAMIKAVGQYVTAAPRNHRLVVYALGNVLTNRRHLGLYAATDMPGAGIVVTGNDIGRESRKTIALSTYSRRVTNLFRNVASTLGHYEDQARHEYRGRLWAGLAGAACAGEFSRRTNSIARGSRIVYDSGIKMHEYLLLGLGAALRHSDMYEGIVLWRMAPWPYTLKEPRSLTTTEYGDQVPQHLKAFWANYVSL